MTTQTPAAASLRRLGRRSAAMCASAATGTALVVGLLAAGPAVAGAPVSAVAGAPATASAPTSATTHGCGPSLTRAISAYIAANVDKKARALEAMAAPDYTIVLPGGTTFVGKKASSSFIDGFFARTDWSQTFAVTSTTRDRCDSATTLLDSTYTDGDGPVHLVIGLSWRRAHGVWQVVLDQNTVVG